MSPIIVFHVAAGGVALLCGFIALFAAKGGAAHRRVGLGFVVAMVAMAVSALIYMVVEAEVIRVNVVASTLVAYLVITSLITVRAPSTHQRAIDAGAAIAALSIGLAGLALGYVATQDPRGLLDGIPSFPYFMFGTIGLLATIGDVRMIRAGGVKGPTRIARHLWRMTYALFIAAMSFFLGQADEFPKAWRVLPVMAGPPMLVLMTMLYWMWRVRIRRSLAALKVTATIALLIAVAPAAGGAQQAGADPVAARLQLLADSVLAARPRIPGLVIHVQSTRDGRQWTVAAGLSDTARRIPMRPEQPFRIASVSKTYVAAAILRLVERGVIALGDPIEKHVPAHLVAELRRDGIRTDVITMEQLLAHRAGLDEHTAVPSYLAIARTDPRKRWTREEQVKLLIDSLQPVGAPGAQFKYSDTGYVLLGAIVERYTGKTLGAGVRELVGMERLGLRQTWWETLEPPPAGIADRAHQYMNGMDTYDLDPSIDLYGGGGIAASMSDVASFMSALQTGRVLEQRATLDTMLAVRSPNFLAGYGLGIYRVNSQGRIGIGHSGYWGTVAVHYPAEGITVALAVTEQSQGGTIHALAGAALRAVLPLIAP